MRRAGLRSAALRPNPAPPPSARALQPGTYWTLQQHAPAYIRRTSDFEAEAKEPNSSDLEYWDWKSRTVAGSVAFDSGRHAWRLTDTSRRLYQLGMSAGVRNAANPHDSAYISMTFGTGKVHCKYAYQVFPKCRVVDFLLDVGRCRLTIVTPQDGTRCEIPLRMGRQAWIPSFGVGAPPHAFRVELIHPRMVGKQAP